MNLTLANKIILVTGAGSGIGRAAALAFAKAGAHVILLGRTQQTLEHTYDLIDDQGGQALIYPLNLLGATPEDYAELAGQIRQEFGQLDGLLHNAARLGQLAPIELSAAHEWYQTFQTNLNAPFMLTQALIPLLKNAAQASVVFTSSGVARHAQAYWGAYAISKAAQDHLMATLAQEFANTSLRFNSIDPGIVRSDMRAKAFPAEDPNQLPTPDSIMAAYLWLMSDASHSTHGQFISAHQLIHQLTQ
jgi:NAD(P)-dependent dehydrogenase (short-subunit alcohol dehydrogenase family)